MLLCNYPEKMGLEYHEWLTQRTTAPIKVIYCPFKNPTDFRRIYTEADSAVSEQPPEAPLAFHLSPGTPAMATVWILLAQTRRYRERCELIQTSKQRGVEKVELPFDIYAEFGPELLRRSTTNLCVSPKGFRTKVAEFDQIIHCCEAMQRAVALARRLALRDVPVLIQGESGTGKELIAKAIHAASQRAKAEIVTVNCGALPPELVDSEFFGHAKGAFTGAATDHQGFFEAAGGGSLFLDEIGRAFPRLPRFDSSAPCKKAKSAAWAKLGSAGSTSGSSPRPTATFSRR